MKGLIMKQIYRIGQYLSIPEHILASDYDFTKEVEPILTQQAVDQSAVVEYLQEQESKFEGWYETAMDNHTKTDYYERYKLFQSMKEVEELKLKELRLQLRVLELIHKYNLTDELED